MTTGFSAELESNLELDFTGPNPDLNKVEDISGYDPLEDAMLEAEPEPEAPELAPVPAPEVPEKPVKGSPHARIRVLERERDAFKRREKEAQDRLVQVLELVLQKEGPAPTEETPEEELDPVLRLEKKLDRVTRTVQEDREAEEAEREQRAIQEQQMAANLAIRAFAQQAGPVYRGAVAHLAAVEMDEYLEEHDDLTPQEAEMALLEKMEADKIKWIASGKNPGRELLLRAIRRGYQLPMQPDQQAQAPAKQTAPRQDVAEELRKENKRTATRSIAALPGASAQNAVNAKALAGMSESDFQNKILRVVRENKGNIRATTHIKDLLAGKGRSR